MRYTASRSSFSVTGQSAASGNPTKTAIIAVIARVRWNFMEQPSSRAGTLSEGRLTSSPPRGPRLRYNWPLVAGSLLRGDVPLRAFIAILIVAVLAPACRRVESVAAVHAVGRDVVLAADKTVVAARVASGA